MQVSYEQHDPMLTKLSVMYKNDLFAADIVMPRVKVGAREDKYPIYDKSAFKVHNIQERKGMSTADEFDYAVTTAQYSTKRYAGRIGLPDIEIEKAERLGQDPRLDAAENLGEMMKREREMRVYTALFAGTKYQALTTYNSVSNPTYVYMDDYTNSNPFLIIGKAKKQFHLNCGVMPTHILMNPDIEEVIASHPKRDTKSSQNSDRVTNNELPEIFMNMKKITAGATYDNSKRGRTENMDYIWGNNIFLFYVSPSPGKFKVSSGYTWDYYGSLRTKQYRTTEAEQGVWVEAEDDVDEKVVCDPCIFILKTVLLNPIG